MFLDRDDILALAVGISLQLPGRGEKGVEPDAVPF